MNRWFRPLVGVLLALGTGTGILVTVVARQILAAEPPPPRHSPQKIFFRSAGLAHHRQPSSLSAAYPLIVPPLEGARVETLCASQESSSLSCWAGGGSVSSAPGRASDPAQVDVGARQGSKAPLQGSLLASKVGSFPESAEHLDPSQRYAAVTRPRPGRQNEGRFELHLKHGCSAGGLLYLAMRSSSRLSHHHPDAKE